MILIFGTPTFLLEKFNFWGGTFLGVYLPMFYIFWGSFKHDTLTQVVVSEGHVMYDCGIYDISDQYRYTNQFGDRNHFINSYNQ